MAQEKKNSAKAPKKACIGEKDSYEGPKNSFEGETCKSMKCIFFPRTEI